MTHTVLVAGASGGIGRHVARAFAVAGWEVRRYARGTDMAEAAQGCDVIFNGLNPPLYHNWKELIPAITAQVVAAAKASGATIVMPATVYVYGTEPEPWTEATPHRPVSRKGRIRAEMEDMLRAASRDGVQVLLVRAGDFIDADNPQTLLRMAVLRGLKRGRITATGDPDAPRAWVHTPDLARAIVAVAERRAALPAFHEVGMPGYTFSFADLARMLEPLTGRRIRIGRFPWWALRLAAPVHELSRELLEMRYLHGLPHEIDGSRFHALLPDFHQTPLETVIAAHLPDAPQSSAMSTQTSR